MRLTCPICGLEADIPDDVISGEVIEHDCGAVLEVVMDGSSVQLRPFLRHSLSSTASSLSLSINGTR